MATQIHPTAVVHASAELGDDVEIGPYCVIHEGVTIGEGTWLQNHVTIAGPTAVGASNKFFAYASIGQQTQEGTLRKSMSVSVSLLKMINSTLYCIVRKRTRPLGLEPQSDQRSLNMDILLVEPD